MRATGFRPFSAAVLARVRTRAAAPSLMLEALAAVMVPSLLKAGRSVGILEGSPFSGCSSLSMVSVPLRVLISTAVISRSNQPERWAVWARVRLVTA